MAGHGGQLLGVGTQAPGFQLESLDNGAIGLADMLAQGPVLLAFSKISCPVCQLTFPFLQRLHEAGAVSVYGISQDDAEGAREFIEAFGVGFPVLLDSEDDGFPVSSAFGIGSVPTLYLIERDGSIAGVTEGWQKRAMLELAARNHLMLFREGEHVPEWRPG